MTILSDKSRLLQSLSPLVARVLPDEPMSRHASFGIGGPADFYVEVETDAQAIALLKWTRENGLPLFPVGQGSNLLVSDKGIRGVVVRLRGAFNEFTFDGERVTAGAGVTWPRLAMMAAERGLSGLEPLVGIPGTVGGGLMSNAGTPEGDTASVLESVDLLEPDGSVRLLGKNEMNFAYRSSSLVGRFVLRARLKLRGGDKTDIMARIQKQLARRAQTQPLGTDNVGSIFKNPPGRYAAQLIESSGLKGTRVGGAEVSTKHANFIVNAGGATSADVLQLVERIRRTVEEKHGVRLELEMIPVGEA